MKNKYGKIFIVFHLLFFYLNVEEAMTQVSEEPDRLSIGILAGVSTGSVNMASALSQKKGAFLEYEKEYYFTGGLNVRYAVSPKVAFQGDFSTGSLSFTGGSETPQDLIFGNKYLTSRFSAQFNFLKIFGGSSEWFHLYGSMGSGFMFNNTSVRTLDESDQWVQATVIDQKSQAIVNSIGAGFRMNALQRVDFFVQFDHNISTRDIVDGYLAGEFLGSGRHVNTSNRWSTFSLGVQIKIGRSRTDSDWHRPAFRFPEAVTSGSGGQYYSCEINHLAAEIDILNQRIDSIGAKTVEADDTDAGAFITADEFRELMNELFEIRESMLPIYGLYGQVVEEANDGYTIIVHSLTKKERAISAVEDLKENGYRALLMPLKIEGTHFFRVGIGQFRTNNEARNAAGDLPGSYNDQNFIWKIE